MSIEVLIEAADWTPLGLQGLAERADTATLTYLELSPAAYESVLLGCEDARIAALNADFRGKPQPTNVLSWPSEERGAETPGDRPALPRPGELGDIALAFQTCAREAAELGIPIADHVTHLIVHGLLHLLGYDHIEEEDAVLMERLETQILATLGIPDPY